MKKESIETVLLHFAVSLLPFLLGRSPAHCKVIDLETRDDLGLEGWSNSYLPQRDNKTYRSTASEFRDLMELEPHLPYDLLDQLDSHNGVWAFYCSHSFMSSLIRQDCFKSSLYYFSYGRSSLDKQSLTIRFFMIGSSALEVEQVLADGTHLVGGVENECSLSCPPKFKEVTVPLISDPYGIGRSTAVLLRILGPSGFILIDSIRINYVEFTPPTVPSSSTEVTTDVTSSTITVISSTPSGSALTRVETVDDLTGGWKGPKPDWVDYRAYAHEFRNLSGRYPDISFDLMDQLDFHFGVWGLLHNDRPAPWDLDACSFSYSGSRDDILYNLRIRYVLKGSSRLEIYAGDDVLVSVIRSDESSPLAFQESLVLLPEDENGNGFSQFKVMLNTTARDDFILIDSIAVNVFGPTAATGKPSEEFTEVVTEEFTDAVTEEFTDVVTDNPDTTVKPVSTTEVKTDTTSTSTTIVKTTTVDNSYLARLDTLDDDSPAWEWNYQLFEYRNLTQDFRDLNRTDPDIPFDKLDEFDLHFGVWAVFHGLAPPWIKDPPSISYSTFTRSISTLLIRFFLSGTSTLEVFGAGNQLIAQSQSDCKSDCQMAFREESIDFATGSVFQFSVVLRTYEKSDFGLLDSITVYDAPQSSTSTRPTTASSTTTKLPTTTIYSGTTDPVSPLTTTERLQTTTENLVTRTEEPNTTRPPSPTTTTREGHSTVHVPSSSGTENPQTTGQTSESLKPDITTTTDAESTLETTTASNSWTSTIQTTTPDGAEELKSSLTLFMTTVAIFLPNYFN